jgi:hypothetical protein
MSIWEWVTSAFTKILRCFSLNEVRYLVVGGHAVIHYTQPRYTKDLDLWLEATPENSHRVAVSFHQCEAFANLLGFLMRPDVSNREDMVRGMRLADISRDDLAVPGREFFVGSSPEMLDFLTSVAHLEFGPCWSRRTMVKHDFGAIHYLGLEDLRTTKRRATRSIDLTDLEALDRSWLERRV